MFCTSQQTCSPKCLFFAMFICPIPFLLKKFFFFSFFSKFFSFFTFILSKDLSLSRQTLRCCSTSPCIDTLGHAHICQLLCKTAVSCCGSFRGKSSVNSLAEENYFFGLISCWCVFAFRLLLPHPLDGFCPPECTQCGINVMANEEKNAHLLLISSPERNKLGNFSIWMQKYDTNKLNGAGRFFFFFLFIDDGWEHTNPLQL